MQYDWAIMSGDWVIDRWTTEEEARAELSDPRTKLTYPGNARVVYLPEPER